MWTKGIVQVWTYEAHSKFQNAVSHIKVEGEVKTKNIKYSWVLELHIIKNVFILPQSETEKNTLRTYNIIYPWNLHMSRTLEIIKCCQEVNCLFL